MAKLSVSEKAALKKRSAAASTTTSDLPQASSENTTASQPPRAQKKLKGTVIPSVEISSSPEKELGKETSAQKTSMPGSKPPTKEAPATLAPGTEPTQTEVPSYFDIPLCRNRAYEDGNSLVREVDLRSLQGASSKALSEAACVAACQLLTLQKAMFIKNRQLVMGKQNLRQALEEQQVDQTSKLSSAEAKITEQDKRLADLENTKNELNGVILSLKDEVLRAKQATKDAEARMENFKASAEFASIRMADLEAFKKSSEGGEWAASTFKASIEYAELRKAIIEAFKRSDEGIDWAEEGAVDYLDIGFERCRLQLLDAGLLPADFDAKILDIGRTMPGEPPEPKRS